MYCTACQTAKVEVADGVCERCAGLGRSPGDYDRHEVDGYEVVKKTLALINRTLETLRFEFTGLASDDPRRDSLVQRMAGLGRSVAAVAKEARAFEEYMAKEARSLTKEQKMQIVVPFFESLSPEQQKTLIQKLLRSYNDRGGYKVQERKGEG